MPSVSSKEYKPGDVIFVLESVFFCLLNKYQTIYCNNCLKRSDTLKRCSKCRQMYYCSKNCQISDWKFHKKECKLYLRFDISLLHIYLRGLLRLWLYVKNDPEFSTKTYQLIGGSDISLNEIKVNKKKLFVAKNVNFDNMTFDLICQYFKSFGIDFNTKELLRWYAIISPPVFKRFKYYDENPLNIFDSIVGRIGSGLFPQLSNIGHSCLANCALISSGNSFQLRAVKPIKLGEELTLCYTSLARKTSERKHQLEAFSIDCHCDRCRLNLDEDWDWSYLIRIYLKNCFHWEAINDINGSRILSSDYTLDSELLSYVDQIYGSNHWYGNELLSIAFICFALYSRHSNPLVLTTWYKNIKKSLYITHGKDHNLVKMISKVYFDHQN